MEPISKKNKLDSINMHCKLTNNYASEFNSKMNEVLGLTQKYYSFGEHVSEKVIIIMLINKNNKNK